MVRTGYYAQIACLLTICCVLQSKKRRRYRDDDSEREKSPDLEEKLKDATTLYVGNLYAFLRHSKE